MPDGDELDSDVLDLLTSVDDLIEKQNKILTNINKLTRKQSELLEEIKAGRPQIPPELIETLEQIKERQITPEKLEEISLRPLLEEQEDTTRAVENLSRPKEIDLGPLLEAQKGTTEAVEDLSSELGELQIETVPGPGKAPKQLKGIEPLLEEQKDTTQAVENLSSALEDLEIGDISVAATEERGLPVVSSDMYDGSDRTYQEVVTWEVGHEWGRRFGKIHEVQLITNKPKKTQYHVRFMGPEGRTRRHPIRDLVTSSAVVNVPLPPHKMIEDTEIKIEASSTDGENIHVIGMIIAKEWGER